MARGGATKASNEEFLHALYKGGELLAAGKVIEAKDFLEKAFKLQPKNEKGQNLLGLTYFKLGLFDRAAEIYEALVRENPADATLRVNLGLVYLKTNNLQRAVREFETATDLQPDHRKAHNYLGLALAQAGEFARAKQHFVEAGSEAMAEKMDRALRGEDVGAAPEQKPLAKQKGFAEIEGSEVVAERGGEVPPEGGRPPVAAAPPPPAVVPMPAPAAPPGLKPASHGAPHPVELMSEEPPPAEQAQALTQQDWGAQFSGPEAEVEVGERASGQEAAAPPPGDVEGDAFSEEAMSAPPPEPAPPQAEVVELSTRRRHTDVERQTELEVEAPSEAEAQAGEGAMPTAPPPALTGMPPSEAEGALSLPIAELAPTLQLFAADSPGPFAVKDELVALVVREQLLLRMSGFVALSGKLEFQPEAKRFRGRATDKPFGEGEERMIRASGHGTVLVHRGERQFVSMELNDESGYFQEDHVFAFEEALAFENGRVPSEVPPDLDLVHLRGKGRVLLTMSGPLRSLQVTMERPVTVPMSGLVGWYGNLTPRVAPLLLDAKGRPTRMAVELAGEGFALISVPLG